MNIACVGLAASLLAQVALSEDFHGMPFLMFGIIVGVVGVSLFLRTVAELIGRRLRRNVR